MPLQNTSGSDTTDAYGGGVAVVPNYIEQVFSTYLYTGNGSTQSINNGIDLSTKGGMVWTKCRSNGQNNWIFDTVRGANSPQSTNTTDSAADAYATYFDPATNIVLANTTGYSLAQTGGGTNTNGFTYAGWTFRKQPKFFDVVTWTGDGVSTGRQISHNLGSTPGFIVGKATSGSGFWRCFHRSLSTSDPGLKLNQTSAGGNSPYDYGDQSTVTAPTSTQFTAGINLNSNGTTYVAYLFAHNAGGFGLTGTDNVISCGLVTGGGTSVNLGYEPQFIIIKPLANGYNWQMNDTMRGWTANVGASQQSLASNLSDAEYSGYDLNVTSTGFYVGAFSGIDCIYIAIRRGPMAVPTTGTSVFSPVARTGTGTSTAVTTPNFPPDMLLQARRDGPDWPMSDRLRGVGKNLAPCYTSAENTPSPAYVQSYDMTGATLGSGNAVNGSGLTYIEYFFKRAPSFFDEVCYTGNSTSGTTIAHNLGATPELIIVKQRNASRNWYVGNTSNGWTTYLQLNSTIASTAQSDIWSDTAPTSSVFTVGSSVGTNQSGSTYVAYLFATCVGVSKVGSYTGNGTTQAIACGFTGGARFVLIKCTSATGDWYVYDTARGMTTLTDPYLLINSTAAETATLGSVTTTTGGFTVNASILSAINTNGGSYIFLAIS